MNQFIYPYLLLEDAKAAADYYVEMFKGEIIYIMYGKDTPNCPEERLEEVFHLQLKFHDNQIFMSDHVGEKPNNVVQIHLDYMDKDEMIAAFNRFKEESKIIQDVGETYWGAIFGVLEDKFGITWQFHYMLEQE